MAFREYGGLQVAGIAYYNTDGDLHYIEDPPLANVPEPSTLLLMLVGVAGLSGSRRRQISLDYSTQGELAR